MSQREGSLEAPTRHPIAWKEEQFWDEAALNQELERVYDICHGCRRCVSLCDAFPTLFDLVDESETMEVDGVDVADYGKVVDQCYMCDLCYLTKCPYVPPHEWNLDFPHLMLRAKAQSYKKTGGKFRDNLLTSTDAMGKALTLIPLVDVTTNALNKNGLFRNALEKTLGVHKEAPLPEYSRKTLRKRFSPSPQAPGLRSQSKEPPARSPFMQPATATTPRQTWAMTSSKSLSTTTLGLNLYPRKPAAACQNSNWEISTRSQHSKSKTSRSWPNWLTRGMT